MKYTRKHCLFCGEQESIQDLYPQTFEIGDLTPDVFSARRSTDHLHYRMVRCRNCGLVFSRDILPEDVLNHLYSESRITFLDYTDIIKGDYWRCIEPFLDGTDKRSALEIGCSTGFFLDQLLDRGFENVFGVEPSLQAKEKASREVQKNITLGFFTEGQYSPNTFDLVCSFHTLDHLSDPLGVLEQTRRILKPGGLAYFITHDVGALQARVLREKSPIIDVEHIYLFNKETLRKLFENSGLDVLELSALRNSYPVDYWLTLFPLATGAKKTLRKIVNSLGVGSMALPLKAGDIFVVARRPADN